MGTQRELSLSDATPTLRRRMDSYCTIGLCEEATRDGRTMCDMHEKRWQRGKRGAELTAPPAEDDLTPMERAMETFKRLMDSDTDEEYAANERALRRALKTLAPQAQAPRNGEAIRQGIAKARARGVRHGRPPGLEPIAPLVREMAGRIGLKPTARALGTTYRAVRRVLKTPVSDTAPALAGQPQPEFSTPEGA